MRVGHAEHGDAILVGLAQAGDGEAFAELFRRHYPAVQRACAARVVDAEEVAQAAFVRAFERIGLCRGEQRFGAWVHVIARHLCADAARARARASTLAAAGALPVPVPGPDWPEEHALRRERVEAVRSVVRRLPRRQREVLVARDLEGRRPAEIAAALGLSLGAVDSLLLRARRATAAGYRTMAAEQGMATTASSAVVAVAAGGTATSPTGLGRAARRGVEAVRQAVGRLGVRLGALPGAPPGLELVAGAAVVVALAASAGAPLPGHGRSPAVTAPAPGPAGPGLPADVRPPFADPAVPAPETPPTPSPPETPATPPVAPPAPFRNPTGAIFSRVDVEAAAGTIDLPWRPETPETPLDGLAPLDPVRLVPDRPGRAAWEAGWAAGGALWQAGRRTAEDAWDDGREAWNPLREKGRETWRKSRPGPD